jgi:DedD protein
MPVPIEPPVTTAAPVPDSPDQEEATNITGTIQNPTTDQPPLDIIGIPETEIISQSSPVPAEKTPTEAQTKQVAELEPETTGLTAWVVQLGSFSSQENASGLVKQLQKEGYPAFLEQLDSGNGVVYRVRVGPEVLQMQIKFWMRFMRN